MFLFSVADRPAGGKQCSFACVITMACCEGGTSVFMHIVKTERVLRVRSGATADRPPRYAAS